VDVNKYFLDKIVRLGFVPENPLTNISDETRVPPEEHGKGLAIARTDIGQKRFVGGLCLP
jgi:hypothetical protein